MAAQQKLGIFSIGWYWNGLVDLDHPDADGARIEIISLQDRKRKPPGVATGRLFACSFSILSESLRKLDILVDGAVSSRPLPPWIASETDAAPLNPFRSFLFLS